MDNILNGTIVLKGSLNSLGRQLGIEPTTPYPYQPFNMNEMLRTTIVQKLFGYVQTEALFRVFHTLGERPTEHEALTLFKKQYPTITTPTVAFTEISLHRYYDKNVRCATIPGESRVLPFWACDTHHSKLATNGNRIFFTFPLPSVRGKVTITVRIPNGERFTRFDKVSRPTVYVDGRGRVTFVFAFITDIPKKPTTTIMGVDLGKVEPFVATILNPTEHTYSSPYLVELIREAPVEDYEVALVAAALRTLRESKRFSFVNPPLLKDLRDEIARGSQHLAEAVFPAGRETYEQAITPLMQSLFALLDGPLGQVFSGHTTTRLDLDSPALCIDVSKISRGDKKLKAAVMLSCWSDAYGAMEAAHFLDHHLQRGCS